MSSTPAPGVITDTARLVRDAADGDRGALWRLAEPERQLDSNVIRLAPDAEVAGHVEPDLDVLVCVVGGSGQLETAGGARSWRPARWSGCRTARGARSPPDRTGSVTSPCTAAAPA